MGTPVQNYARLYRVRDWLHFLPLPLATVDPDAPARAALWAAGRGIAGAASLLAFGYLLNSVADRRMDLDARKNPLIIPGAAEPRYVLALLLALSLVLALLGPWPVQVATVVCIVFFWIYSSAPRIKSIPVAGSLANIGMFVPLLFLGMREDSLPPRIAHLALACGALVLETQLVHEAADQDEDRAGGIRTTWLTLGPRWTAAVAGLSGLAAAVAAARIETGVLLPAFAISVFVVAFPVLLAWRGGDPAQAARLRLAHRWCAVIFGAGLFAAWRGGM